MVNQGEEIVVPKIMPKSKSKVDLQEDSLDESQSPWQ